MTQTTYENNKDFYILGYPIKTSIGKCYPLKVKDYPILLGDLNIVSLTKLHYMNDVSQSKDSEENKEELLQTLRGMNLMDIVFHYREITEIYMRVYTHFFQDDTVFFNIENEEQFLESRQVILESSCIQEEEINPNPEIQRAIERSRRVKNKNQEKTTFTDIATSVSINKGIGYGEIAEMTLYQLYMDFHRIAQIKNHEMTTLFATVSGEVEIENWSKHINLFEEESHGLSRNEFSKIAGVME